MGYFRDQDMALDASGITHMIKEGVVFSISTYAAALANNATVALKIYASATAYPSGIHVHEMVVDSDSGPFTLSFSTYNTFTFSTYAASTNWRYPKNRNFIVTNTMASVTMSTATKASTPAVVFSQSFGVRNSTTQADVNEIILKPATGYRMMITNLSGANRIVGFTTSLHDPAHD